MPDGASSSRFLSVTEESFDDHIGANFKSTFFSIQKAVPLLRPGASVLINGSVVAGKGWPNTNITAAIKAAIRSLARTLSAELLDRGIRVNTISPGPIDTEFFGRHADDDGAAKKNLHLKINPSKRLGTAEEELSWLCSWPRTIQPGLLGRIMALMAVQVTFRDAWHRSGWSFTRMFLI